MCIRDRVSVGFEIGNSVTEINGTSTVKDLDKMFELVYGYATDLQPDEKAYKAQIDALIGILRDREKSPEFMFQQRLGKARACNNPLYERIPSVAMLESANYDQMLALMKKAMSNAADYTFVFTGNVTPEVLTPYLEKYIATLPSTGKAVAPKVISPVPSITGIVNDKFDVPMATPSTQVFVTLDDNNLKYSIKDATMVEAIGDVLDIRFTETLREEEGGTYSPQVFSGYNPWTNYWSLNYWFQTNSDVQNKLIARANAETEKLLNQGADAAAFAKVKEAMVKQYEINVRTNKYWANNLMSYLRGVDNLTDHKAAIDGMTLDGLNKFMKTLYNGKNRLNFVMTGVPMAK